jgi:hypothetical protein
MRARAAVPRAEDLLARLEADPAAAQVSAAIARTAILAARGRFAEACLIEHIDDPREGPAAREARLRGLELDWARYLLFAAITDPGRDVDTDAYIRCYLIRHPPPGWGSSSGYDGEIRALDRLRHGTPADAARQLRYTLRSTTSPLSEADRLCTRALIQAAGGRRRAAVSIDRARRIAPWYPRVEQTARVIALPLPWPYPAPEFGAVLADSVPVLITDDPSA